MLVVVAIPTEMAYAETNDLVKACKRLGVAVPILYVNMLTPASSCPICSVLSRAEELVIDRFNKTFAVQHRTLVYRQKEEPRGIESLYALGQSLYLA